MEKQKKKNYYEGLKPVLIHLPPDVHKLLNFIAKKQDKKLKKYLERLAINDAQRHYESFQKGDNSQ